MLSWVVENTEWLFGGVAVAVPLALLGWISKKRRSEPEQKNQTQITGDDSVNNQVGGSVNITYKNEK